MSFLYIINSSSSVILFSFLNLSSQSPKSILDTFGLLLFFCAPSVDIWYIILFVSTILFWFAHSIFKQTSLNLLYIPSLWLSLTFSFWHKLLMIPSGEQLSSILVISCIGFSVSNSSSFVVLSIIIWGWVVVGIWGCIVGIWGWVVGIWGWVVEIWGWVVGIWGSVVGIWGWVVSIFSSIIVVSGSERLWLHFFIFIPSIISK